MKNDELLHRWVNEELSEQELQKFKERPEYESLVELYKNTADFSAPGFDSDKMLAKIISEEKINVSKGRKGRRIFLRSFIKYAAAAVVLILTGWYLFIGEDNMVEYEIAKGERLDNILPDGSLFFLNAESSLSFNKKLWTKERTLDLKGEAFFEVKNGSKFSVKTATGTVEVIGTKFNVRSRDNILEVKCQSGQVKVISADGSQANDLVKDDAIRLEKGKAPERWTFQSSDKASWVEGISKFRSVEVVVVIKELERQFDIEIDVGTVNIREIVSCNFSHKVLESALKTSFDPLGIQYEVRDEKKVYLYK